MKKEIIKCDFCGRIIERDDTEYYEITHKNTEGFSSIRRSEEDIEKQMCIKCARNKKIND